MAVPVIVADFESQLATAIAVGGTSFTLSSVTDDDGVALPSGTYYFTVDNGASSKEYLLGQLSGSSVTGVYTVSRQGVETSGAARAHRVGASVIITDFATYKKYIDGIAIAGAPNAAVATKGISTLSTAPVSPTSPIAVGDNDPRIAPNNYAADAGATDAYAITLATAPTAYVTGQVYNFKANTTNTGEATLNVNSLGAKTIVGADGATLTDGAIQAGQIVSVVYDGTNLRIFNTGGVNLQTFTASGTWNKPSGARFLEIFAIGGGGGGGGGQSGGNPSGGGGGGGGGGYSHVTISALLASSTETVTVGAGGTGGTGGTSAAGTNGTAGGTSSFGTLVTATGGGLGVGGTGSAGTAGAAGAGGAVSGAIASGAGGAGNTAGAGTAGGAVTSYAPSGGGGAGGSNGAAPVNAGAAGGARSGAQTVAGGAAGTTGNGGAGVSTTANSPIGGTGGGGGAGQFDSAVGGNGGAGGIYGGGGGGGGGCETGAKAGNGGAGGAGIVVVISY